MLGPTVFALVIVIGFEQGVRLLGAVFAAAVALFWALQLIDKKIRVRECEIK